MKIILGAVTIALFLALYLLVTIVKATRRKSLRAHEEKERELVASIRAKMEQLELLNKELEKRSIRNDVKLSNMVINVLDRYEQSNIVLPVDIIEELSYRPFETETGILDYIENQRYQWRLENTKKVMK